MKIFIIFLFTLSFTVYGICGDSNIEQTEACDDGNRINGDGCSSSCTIETGWSCATANFNLDFNEVFEGAHSDEPIWTLSNNNRTLNQSVNSEPGIYVSTLPVNNHVVEFTLEVKTWRDDDFIGWAVAYEEGENDSDNIDWILFDWKQVTQAAYGSDTAFEGLNMWKVNQKLHGAPSIWAHEAMTKMATGINYGTVGWADNTLYRVKMEYTTSNIKIYIDDVLEFDVYGSFPANAKLSFYTYSQRDDEFILTAPLEGSICNEICGDGIKMPLEECDDGNKVALDGCFGCVVESGWRCNENSPSQCSDIDECSENSDNCSEFATCTNTPSSFECNCNSGYLGDGVSCTDIDECLTEVDNCSQNCTNTEGSFTCSCNDGYTLNNDGFTCDDINECSDNSDNCSQICTNTEGSFTCSCNTGYFQDGINCTDIDECSDNSDNCSQNCTNREGSFTCSCNDGYILNNDGFTCDEINECNPNPCNSGICTDKEDSYSCNCDNTGYRGDNCEIDIDECSENLDNCSEFATCTNRTGTFFCSCNDNYFGDGINCESSNYQGSSMVGCNYNQSNGKQNYFFLLFIILIFFRKRFITS